jgi:hypothetical protein
MVAASVEHAIPSAGSPTSLPSPTAVGSSVLSSGSPVGIVAGSSTASPGSIVPSGPAIQGVPSPPLAPLQHPVTRLQQGIRKS